MHGTRQVITRHFRMIHQFPSSQRRYVLLLRAFWHFLTRVFTTKEFKADLNHRTSSPRNEKQSPNEGICLHLRNSQSRAPALRPRKLNRKRSLRDVLTETRKNGEAKSSHNIPGQPWLVVRLRGQKRTFAEKDGTLEWEGRSPASGKALPFPKHPNALQRTPRIQVKEILCIETDM
jgi:hypothetical protein